MEGLFMKKIIIIFMFFSISTSFATNKTVTVPGVKLDQPKRYKLQNDLLL